jgi:hypothetical protein
MRPAGTYGEVRAALMKALETEGPLTIRDAAQRTQIGLQAARWAIADSVRRGAVRECGSAKPAKGTKWQTIYEVTPEPEPDESRAGHGWVDLGRVVGGWAR